MADQYFAGGMYEPGGFSGITGSIGGLLDARGNPITLGYGTGLNTAPTTGTAPMAGHQAMPMAPSQPAPNYAGMPWANGAQHSQVPDWANAPWITGTWQGGPQNGAGAPQALDPMTQGQGQQPDWLAQWWASKNPQGTPQQGQMLPNGYATGLGSL